MIKIVCTLFHPNKNVKRWRNWWGRAHQFESMNETAVHGTISPTWKEINLTTLPSNHSYLGDVWKRSNRNLVFISHCDPSQTISFLLHLHAMIAPIIRIRVNLYSCMMDNILAYIKYMHGNHIVCLLWTMRHMINYTCHWIE